MANTEIAPSSALPFLSAAMMPSGIAMTAATTSAMSASLSSARIRSSLLLQHA
jgi:hypothetical protein